MHGPITAAPDGRTLLRDGTPFFWLADTCWSAFTSIFDREWEDYLNLRAEQGFTVLQLNTLAQWDRCSTPGDRHPFATADGICYDFTRPDPAYFAHARAMCRTAVEKGFTLALVVMWCNYVPDTWAARIFPENVMPESCVEPVVRTICENFREFAPVWIVSGDTDFKSEAARDRYRQVTELVEQYAPGLPKAYHICGRSDDLPDWFARHADFYLYQSGHNRAGQDCAFTLAEHFAALQPRRPVINSEPCYEQMGYSHREYGRFRRQQTRQALWQSLLAGACAGITYGAHGVWNWQKEGIPAPKLVRTPGQPPVTFGEGFLRALPWDRAVQFPGAADYAFARQFFLQGSGEPPVPCQEILAAYAPQVRAARRGRQVLIYLPVNAPLPLHGDWSGYTATALDLSGTAARAPLTVDLQRDQTLLGMHPFYEDALLILQPKQDR